MHSLTHDTRLYRFVPKAGDAAANGADACSLDPGQHIKVTVDVRPGVGGSASSGSPPGSSTLWEVEQKTRSYTPVVLPLPLPAGSLLRGDASLAPNSSATPTLDLLVKVYPTGAVSSTIDSLNMHESVTVSQATGGLPWAPEEFTEVCMVYGGTGISPMLGIMKKLVGLKGCVTNVHVIACNRGVQDIILKDQLDQLRASSNGRLNVTHVLSKLSSDREGEALPASSQVESSDFEFGRISSTILEARLPPAGDGVLVLICGRPSFAQSVASMLRKTGRQYHVFG